MILNQILQVAPPQQVNPPQAQPQQPQNYQNPPTETPPPEIICSTPPGPNPWLWLTALLLATVLVIAGIAYVMMRKKSRPIVKPTISTPTLFNGDVNRFSSPSTLNTTLI